MIALHLIMKTEQIALSYICQKLKKSPENMQDVLSEFQSGQNFTEMTSQLYPAGASKIENKVWLKMIEQIRRHQDQGIQFVHFGEAHYPKAFTHMIDPPLVLSYLGTSVWREFDCLSIVGSREPSLQSEQWLEFELHRVLHQRTVCVVSGGARGVDQIAHLCSLRAGRPTIAILPSGLDKVYPNSFRSMISAMIEGGGAILSEFSPWTEMRKHHFYQRNRLIAALGIFTLVVDAKERSGSMVTAKHSLELGKPVLVVPSHPYDQSNRGALKLLLDGATPVMGAEDLVTIYDAEQMGYSGALLQIDQSNSIDR